MEQLADIRKRLRSVNEIKTMTRAMRLISAVKMRRARTQLDRTLPFFSHCARSIIELRDAGVAIDNPFYQLRQKRTGETWKIGYFILTGDQGLAGAYNHNVVSAAEEHIQSKMIDNTQKGLKTTAKLYVSGSIGRERLIHDGFDVDPDFRYSINQPTFYQARDISDYLFDLYDNGKVDLVYFIYTQIESAISMRTMITRILPINPDALEKALPIGYTPGKALVSGDVEYLPSVEDVASYLIATYLTGMVYGALVEAFASEQTSRMTAMDNATENATDMIERLTLMNNRARQNRITIELAEIVGGAEVTRRISADDKRSGDDRRSGATARRPEPAGQATTTTTTATTETKGGSKWRADM